MPREFWYGVLVGIAFCVVLAAAGYALYLWYVHFVQRRWNDPEDSYRDANVQEPTIVNRDPLAPPFPPQAAGDPDASPVVHNIRWSRRAPRND